MFKNVNLASICIRDSNLSRKMLENKGKNESKILRILEIWPKMSIFGKLNISKTEITIFFVFMFFYLVHTIE